MEFSRGITPETLLEHVRNTIPYALSSNTPPTTPYLRTVWEASRRPPDSAALSHFEYFRLCVSSHFSTVSSFVPTDVDNQIRHKLWHPELSPGDCSAMVALVTEALHWDMTVLSRRFVRGPESGRVLSGMHGEWFSIAAGAYCALRARASLEAEGMRVLIVGELQREAEVLGEFVKTRDGIGLLKAATSIAHNLGDLDRVMDQWNLDAGDPLRARAYRTGHDDPARFGGLLKLAGELNKLVLTATGMAPTSMAAENHRHFALRQARSLRRSPDLLLPISPFFDDWGAIVGKHPQLSPEEVGEITQCLMDGWDKLKPIQKTAAYPRALAGIESSFSGGLSRLCQYLPAKSAKNLRSGLLRTITSIRRDRLEAQWGEQALKVARTLSP
jgi:hypothetical protein